MLLPFLSHILYRYMLSVCVSIYILNSGMLNKHNALKLQNLVVSSGINVIDGSGGSPRISSKRGLEFDITHEASKGDHRSILKPSDSDPESANSDGQRSQSAEIQREEKDQKIREDDSIRIKEGVCGNAAQNQRPIRQTERR